MQDGGYGTYFNGPDYQKLLVDYGYVVVPSDLARAFTELLGDTQEEFNEHFRESPELLNPEPENPEWTNVATGADTMGNPSSFHHPFVRKMREMCEAVLLDNDVLPLQGRALEQCFCPMMRRTNKQPAAAESWHRGNIDADGASEGDDFFGGWINFGNEQQTFVCVPQTHKAEFDGTVVPKESHAVPVKVPPGHILVFDERILRKVDADDSPDAITMCLFLGWRATAESDSLFGRDNMTRCCVTHAPPKLMSGKLPDMYPDFGKEINNVTWTVPMAHTFSTKTFVSRVLFPHVVEKQGDDGVVVSTTYTYKVVPKNMRALALFPDLNQLRPYDIHETGLLTPMRELRLYTFDTPTVRMSYKLVSADYWKKHAPSDSSMRRPRPERVYFK
tara:strand:- start:140 stop:1306 length:1167 start_codon:yes stop_codon:yes gene_type:complete